MREILFRGKDPESGEWYYGYYVKRNDGDRGSLILEDYFLESYEIVKPETVGQYTGLKDLYGTRIFEADIVKVYDVYCNETVVGVVEFCDGSFRIYDTDFTSYDRWMYCKVEVIGNVYDNQELLEEDKT